MSDGVQKDAVLAQAYEWLPSLPAQNPFARSFGDLAHLFLELELGNARGAVLVVTAVAPYA